MRILINLIGGQPAPVYIASRIINPDLNVLCYSMDSEKQISRIKNTMSGFNYEYVPVLPYSYEDCIAKINSVVEKYPDAEFVLNLTSGTKIMSFAGFKIFSDMKKDILYIDSQNHNSIYFKNGNVPETKKLNLTFPVKDYFSIYGYHIESGDNRFPDDETYKNIREFMISNYFQIKNVMTKINYQIKAKANLLESIDDSGNLYFRYNIKKEKGIIKCSNGRVKTECNISSKNELDYIMGYWMEDYVYYKLISENIFDELLKNVKIYSIRDNLQPEYQNEFDLCGIRDQTIYIFECKTGNLDKGIVEKLRLIKNLTGTYSKIHLITLFRPMVSASTERIRDFNIKHINLNEMDNYILEFKNRTDINPNL